MGEETDVFKDLQNNGRIKDLKGPLYVRYPDLVREMLEFCFCFVLLQSCSFPIPEWSPSIPFPEFTSSLTIFQTVFVLAALRNHPSEPPPPPDEEGG